MQYLLGIDAGTSSFKAVLYDLAGNAVASAGEEYELITPAPEMVEFPADEYYQVLCRIIREILSKAKISPDDIRSLAIDSQGETLIPVDREGNALYNAIVWLDNRADAQSEALKARFGDAKVFAITGQPEMSPCWPAAKILWLKENHPDIFAKTHKYLLLEDYLIYRLTGEFAAEKSLLSSTTYFDIHTGTWWPEMLEVLGITPAQLPAIYESAKPVAPVASSAAGDTGLSGNTLVVTGALDQIAGMLGAGATDMLMETTGSCLAVLAPIDHAPTEMTLPIPCHVHAIEGKYLLNAWAPTAGLVLKWFKDGFYQESHQGDVYAVINEEAAAVPPGCDGVTILPHFSGAVCPEFDPNARGVVYGLSLQSTRGHITRAIMEAIAYMLRRNLEILKQQGVPITAVRSLGGGAKSPLWNQIKADVAGVTIETVPVEEAACYGAALMAGVGAGLYPSIEVASQKVPVKSRFTPKADPAYDLGYERYQDLYQSLEGMFSRYK